MIKIVLLTTMVCGFCWASVGQSNHDPSISEDNYKHPNKAEIAKKSNKQKKASAYFNEKSAMDKPLQSKGNYKGAFLSNSDSNGLVLKEKEQSQDQSSGNYKAQSQNINIPKKK